MVTKIVFVAGARPNFPKIAPLIRACSVVNNFEIKLVHTGQHYDDAMSDSFFRDLNIPLPDINFTIGGGTHAENTGKTMIEFEKYLLKEMPDLVVVVGDVNATLACSLVAKKCGVKLAHVESGLRSFDDSMPEEINRVLVDRIADYLFVSEESGVRNLLNEGISINKIFFIGNVMIDSLVHAHDKINQSKIKEKLGIDNNYAVLTIHRPALVDNPIRLKEFVDFLEQISTQFSIFWPIHPRTRRSLEKLGLMEDINLGKIILTDPLPYIDFMKLVIDCNLVLTDSGGIQEESSYLGIPCVTFRENTERPSTIDLGTNKLVGFNYALAKEIISDITKTPHRKETKIPLWDGKTSERFRNVLLKNLDF
jgi:UDP-N-acetylglucosamine 2-epimerase (non-hydrolysing)